MEISECRLEHSKVMSTGRRTQECNVGTGTGTGMGNYTLDRDIKVGI